MISINISSALIFIGCLPSPKFMVWKKDLLDFFWGEFFASASKAQLQNCNS
jgi:hypothetical protein